MSINTNVLKQQLTDGLYDNRFREIYADEAAPEYHRGRYSKLIDTFVKKFGESDVSIFSAPGRTEVGGNHTDHQHGMVLAASVNVDVVAVVRPETEPVIRIQSGSYPMMTIDLNKLDPNPSEEGTSTALVRGVAASLKAMGYEIGGFSAVMTSDVLGGSGLSSSAAFEVTVGTILSGIYNEMKIDMVKIAIASQDAECRYFGKPCGLMDQMACAVGGLIFIDFNDPANPQYKKVAVDFAKHGHKLCIVDTKGSHASLTGEYAAIPAEMRATAKAFGKEFLRDVDEKDFFEALPKLRKTLDDRSVLRAFHFFEEEKRVPLQVQALESGDFEGFLKLIKTSGDSSYKYLQNVFPASDVAHQGLSVGLAISDHVLGGQGANRVHGGGFAGTIQAFVPDALAEEYRQAIDHVFGDGSCHVMQIRPVGGICVVE